MNINELLSGLGLSDKNSIVVGSGILQALSIRKSNDIDVVVDKVTFNRLKRSDKLQMSNKYGGECLVNDIFEIVTKWDVLGEVRNFKKLSEDSVVIEEVRYCSLEFIYRVKSDWRRPKDIEDLRLIDDYRSSRH